MSKPHGQRHITNFLLQPLLQVKLGLYSIILALIFCASMVAILYFNFFHLYELILELTDLREEVSAILDDYALKLGSLLLFSFGVYFILTVIITIYYTHRLVGPTYAFRRHIVELKKGNHQSRVNLRKNDAFIEVADELNDLASVLETNAQRRG